MGRRGRDQSREKSAEKRQGDPLHQHPGPFPEAVAKLVSALEEDETERHLRAPLHQLGTVENEPSVTTVTEKESEREIQQEAGDAELLGDVIGDEGRGQQRSHAH